MNYSAGVKLSTYRRKAFMIATSVNDIQYRVGNGKGIREPCHVLPYQGEECRSIPSAIGRSA